MVLGPVVKRPDILEDLWRPPGGDVRANVSSPRPPWPQALTTLRRAPPAPCRARALIDSARPWSDDRWWVSLATTVIIFLPHCPRAADTAKCVWSALTGGRLDHWDIISHPTGRPAEPPPPPPPSPQPPVHPTDAHNDPAPPWTFTRIISLQSGQQQSHRLNWPWILHQTDCAHVCTHHTTH